MVAESIKPVVPDRRQVRGRTVLTPTCTPRSCRSGTSSRSSEFSYGREKCLGERANERRGKNGDVEVRARLAAHRAREPDASWPTRPLVAELERVGVGALKVAGIAGHAVKAQHARLRLYMEVEAVRRRTGADRHVDYA